MTLEEIKKMFSGVVEIYNNGEYIVGEEEFPIPEGGYYNRSKLFKRVKKDNEPEKYIEIKTINKEEFIILEDSPLFDKTNECNWLHCIINPAYHEDNEQFVVITNNKLFTIGPVCKNIELK